MIVRHSGGLMDAVDDEVLATGVRTAAPYADWRPLTGWGNGPSQRCLVWEPRDRSQCAAALASGGSNNYIARGLGRSYGDPAVNGGQGVLLSSRLRRMLVFDPASGRLTCEAGVSLAEIIDVFLPRGWFLPVTPGTKFVTVGGAIAADVHGKNHHRDGSLGNFLDEFSLLGADGVVRNCSRLENADLFWATLGGMGLTGVILQASIRLRKVDSAYVEVCYRRARDLDEALGLFEGGDADYRYSVAWIDCLARGGRLGRSVVMQANEAAPGAVLKEFGGDPLAPPRRPHKSVPCHLPAGALNPWTVAAFNKLYYAAHRNSVRLVDYDRFFYPLDAVSHWNRIYGKRGFVQYQILLPRETSRAGLVSILERLVGSRRASFLAVLKSSGAASPSPLSYLFPGHTLALDLPNTGDDLVRLMHELDDALVAFGGRVYLAKDSVTRKEAFAAMYPRLPEFLNLKSRIDPEGRFSSSQARRLGLTPA
ncbi:MAG TPA: FAD-binding oxidoreductase [Pirellulales bacterium]|nr:FAD-binding oxidoreductase [Pirellulales bacterium]